jgi:hypothetical protein
MTSSERLANFLNSGTLLLPFRDGAGDDLGNKFEANILDTAFDDTGYVLVAVSWRYWRIWHLKTPSQCRLSGKGHHNLVSGYEESSKCRAERVLGTTRSWRIQTSSVSTRGGPSFLCSYFWAMCICAHSVERGGTTIRTEAETRGACDLS